MGKNEFILVRNATSHYMQSHIIREESGKILVVDGGTHNDARYLLSQLKAITGQAVPHIAGWFFTHPHSDHMHCFFEIMETMSDEIEFDAIYCNFPPADYFGISTTQETVDRFRELAPRFADKIVTLHEGDVVSIGTCSFEVLYTPDLSITENRGNNASTVIRLQLGEKSFLLLGDLGLEGGEALLRRHANRLKSDYCQVSHHGQRGCGREVYAAIAPSGCIWTAPDWLWDKEQNEFRFDVNLIEVEWNWMRELGVKEHFVVHSGDVRIEC
ncbi:MAG: hypothetical protein IKM07_01375 [Clostridia bacterium]|nr:hypothetical protein [Clostridia bacterium]